ncbi:MAG TPA: glycosyltransferase family 39 protein [Acidimicrobiales bacterium]|nr:glycosyltransferase family 39 protein [Acidimicrobiales bacterium]
MRTLAADGVVDDPAPASAAVRRSTATPSWLALVAITVVVVAGVVLRFVQRSPLWLDEAQSVNIAALPLGDMFEALRHDGHPPFYYVLLHGWMEVFGESDFAVRALSGVFAVATLPLAWVAGRRLAGRAGARWALVIVALSPYSIRYATETRMYSLVMLLVLAGYLLLSDALIDPRPRRLAALTLISGLLLLSHYWSIYLLAATGLVLAARWWWRPQQRGKTGRAILAVAAGGLLFLPWLPGFLYQAANTGTPWGEPFRPTAIVLTTLEDLGGGVLTESNLAAILVALLVLVALFAARSSGSQLTLDLGTVPVVRRELAVVLVVFVLGSVAGYATDATYQSRYAAVVVPLLLLAVAVGITRIPGIAQLLAGGAYLALSVTGIAWVNHYQRTQAEVVGDAVAQHAEPGDVVVYCPDQLGPDYSRQMPDGVTELAYPTLSSPELVDWVDYAERNRAADPVRIAEDIRAEADGNAIFVVWMPDYRTLDDQCERLLGALGPATQLVRGDDAKYYEPAFLHWLPAAA